LDVVPILQLTQGTQLQPGQHLHGLVRFSQHRVLARTVLELLGFPAVSTFDWTWAVIPDSNFQRYINYSQLPIGRKRVSLGLVIEIDPCFNLSMLPGSVKSINTTVASAALTLERLPLEYHIYSSGSPSSRPLYEVVEDYRPQTMLGVVTGIGGLLAALQGLHTLLFACLCFGD